jgi:glucosylceramidase
MSENTRRDFLKLGSAGAATVVLNQLLPIRAFARSAASTAKVWTTFGDKRHAAMPEIAWSGSANSGTEAIRIDAAQQFQQLLGFGAAFTDAACHNFNRLDKDSRAHLFHELFDPSEMAFNVGRTCIGSSDYSRKAYSYDESAEPDPTLKNFSIEYDREYILPMLREARSVNPDIWLLSSPWSPPGWMKSNGSQLGGSMRKKYFKEYSQYFLKFLQAYAAEGVRINSVTPQNEVDTDQDGRMPACLWGQEYEVEFVRDHLGPALQQAGMQTDIWLLDHNYNLWGRVIDSLEDPRLYQFVKGVAWHGYVGDPTAMTRVKKAFPQLDMFWTEGGPDYTNPTYLTDWAQWSQKFTGILRNWGRCIIAWNFSLDEKGTPNIGPFPCGGLVTIDSRTREITRSGQYWAFAHYSRHIRRGAAVIASSGGPEGVQSAAFRNPNGDYVAVLTNSTTQATKVQIQFGASSATLELQPASITTLAWA